MHTGQLVFAQVMAYLPLKAFSHGCSSSSATQTFLSHGVALQNGFSQCLGQRKPSQAVGSLFGFGTSFDQNGANALRLRTGELGVGVADGRDRLRIGFDYDRLVFEHLQLGRAPFRTTKAAIKLHTLIDLKGSIPSFIHISDGKMHDVKVLDILCKQG